MPYDIPATRVAPALIIYLLNISSSMQKELDGVPKIEHVSRALEKVLISMVRRSTKGEIIASRHNRL